MKRLQHLARQHRAHQLGVGDFDHFRQTNQDSESSECESSDDDDDEEEGITTDAPSTQLLHRRRILLTDPAPPYVPPPTRVAAEVLNCDEDDPSDWKNSNTKKWIVSELNNPSSDIHMLIDENLMKANYKSE